jgi:hypothetical protein
VGGGRSVRVGLTLVVLALAPPLGADTRLIDSPTAEPLGHANARWEIGAGPEGAVLTLFHVGVFERPHFGLSYGMQQVLGSGPVDANPHPGLQAQVLVLDAPGLPALAVGFDSQGRGAWLPDEERYVRKSPGFYAVATQHLAAQSWPLLTAFSGGLGYSLEGGRESIDFFAGVEESLGRHVSLLLDYDFGLDDRGDADRGYLDFGVQWRFQGSFHLRFLLRDLLGNGSDNGEVGRELNFYYLFRL